jgi:hypothetical protein
MQARASCAHDKFDNLIKVIFIKLFKNSVISFLGFLFLITINSSKTLANKAFAKTTSKIDFLKLGRVIKIITTKSKLELDLKNIKAAVQIEVANQRSALCQPSVSYLGCIPNKTVGSLIWARGSLSHGRSW